LKLAVPSFLVKQLQVFHHCLFEPEKFAEKKMDTIFQKKSGHRQKNMDFFHQKNQTVADLFLFF